MKGKGENSPVLSGIFFFSSSVTKAKHFFLVQKRWKQNVTGSGGGDDVLLSIVPRQKAVSHMIDTSIRGLFGGSLWDGAAKGQHNMIDTELYLLPTFLNMIQLSGYSSTDVELLFSWVFGDTFF